MLITELFLFVETICVGDYRGVEFGKPSDNFNLFINDNEVCGQIIHLTYLLQILSYKDILSFIYLPHIQLLEIHLSDKCHKT